MARSNINNGDNTESASVILNLSDVDTASSAEEDFFSLSEVDETEHHQNDSDEEYLEQQARRPEQVLTHMVTASESDLGDNDNGNDNDNYEEGGDDEENSLDSLLLLVPRISNDEDGNVPDSQQQQQQQQQHQQTHNHNNTSDIVPDNDDDDDSDDSMPRLEARFEYDSDESDYHTSNDNSDHNSMPSLHERRFYNESSSDDDDDYLRQPQVWKLNIQTFPQFQELSDDLTIHVLSFVADGPLEERSQNSSGKSSHDSHEYAGSTLTTVLPLVSKKFNSLLKSSSNYFWKLVLKRSIQKEPFLWKEGFIQQISGGGPTKQDSLWRNSNNNDTINHNTNDDQCDDDNNDDEVSTTSCLQLLEKLSFRDDKVEEETTPTEHEETPQPQQQSIHDKNSTKYQHVFQSILRNHVTFTSPCFYMPTAIKIGETVAFHFFEPRYKILIQSVMEDFPPEAKMGEEILPLNILPWDKDGSGRQTQHQRLSSSLLQQRNNRYPEFIYAHSSPLANNSPACIVRVKTCIIHPDGTADVSVVPMAHVRLNGITNLPHTQGLRQASCIRMTHDESILEEEQQRRHQRPTEFDLLELFAEHELRHHGGLGGALGGAMDIPNIGMQGTIRAILAYISARAELEELEDREEEEHNAFLEETNGVDADHEIEAGDEDDDANNDRSDNMPPFQRRHPDDNHDDIDWDDDDSDWHAIDDDFDDDNEIDFDHEQNDDDNEGDYNEDLPIFGRRHYRRHSDTDNNAEEEDPRGTNGSNNNNANLTEQQLR
mmetsp:Transcript_30500/g.46790  ORF Transcript_30500/g.46790 Transcript_30500/m.46790 type:complete len:770 (-) Transcript_30500:308-2617(-)